MHVFTCTLVIYHFHYLDCAFVSFSLKCTIFRSSTFKIPANTSTLIQRWNSVDHQRSSTLFQRWHLVENESWADVRLSTLFQRWQNNVDRITSIQRRWTNVVSTLKFGWKWKFSRHMFMDVVSTLRLNFVSTLILGWKGSLLRKQHWNNFVNICGTEVY